MGESWENEEFWSRWSREGIVLQGGSGGRVHCVCKAEADEKK